MLRTLAVPRPRRGLLAALATAFLLFACSAGAQTATFAWDPSADAAGYVVSWGTAQGVYPNSVDAGPATSRTITAFLPGTTYWVVVQAYSADKLYSDPSTPISFVATCDSSITPSTVSLTSAPADSTLSVTTSSTCGWGASSASPFLLFQNGMGRTGSGSLNFSVTANLSTLPRTGTASVAGRLFTVNQDGVTADPAVAAREHARADFNGDGFSDLLWQDSVGGTRAVWYLQGGNTTRTPAYLNPPVVDLDWQIVGSGDFNGDGKPDLVWWHRVSGTLYLWYMDGVNRIGDGYFSMRGMPDPRWKVAGVADFDGDGHPDILWEHETLGWLGVWEFNDRTFLRGVDLTPNQVDPPWKVVGVGDFNGDGQPDLLWRNLKSGQLGVWLMNGTTRQSFVPLTPQLVDDLDWQIAAVIDINGDQTPDIVWSHATRGSVAVWYMNGTVRMDTQFFPFMVDTTWKIGGPR